MVGAGNNCYEWNNPDQKDKCDHIFPWIVNVTFESPILSFIYGILIEVCKLGMDKRKGVLKGKETKCSTTQT